MSHHGTPLLCCRVCLLLVLSVLVLLPYGHAHDGHHKKHDYKHEKHSKLEEQQEGRHATGEVSDAQVPLVRMVDKYEASGQKASSLLGWLDDFLERTEEVPPVAMFTLTSSNSDGDSSSSSSSSSVTTASIGQTDYSAHMTDRATKVDALVAQGRVSAQVAEKLRDHYKSPQYAQSWLQAVQQEELLRQQEAMQQRGEVVPIQAHEEVAALIASMMRLLSAPFVQDGPGCKHKQQQQQQELPGHSLPGPHYAPHPHSRPMPFSHFSSLNDWLHLHLHWHWVLVGAATAACTGLIVTLLLAWRGGSLCCRNNQFTQRLLDVEGGKGNDERMVAGAKWIEQEQPPVYNIVYACEHVQRN